MYNLVFDKSSIYDMFFFNIKAVTEYSNVKELNEKNEKMFKQWENIARIKYSLPKIGDLNDDGYVLQLNDIYLAKGNYYPEFSKIVAITYGSVTYEENKLKRKLNKIVNEDEFIVLGTFLKILYSISSEGVKQNPQYFPVLCGNNIINYDIPLLLKRIIINRNKFENKENIIPYILKKYLNSKPWDANVLDTLNLWKFNGMNSTPLSSISDSLDLKRNLDLLDISEINQLYWNNIKDNKEDVLNKISLQSANNLNLNMQLINELKNL